MSNGAAAEYTLTGVQQTLGELALSQQEIDQLGVLLDVFKAKRQPQRDYQRHPLRAIKSYLNAKGGMEIFDDGGIRYILRRNK